MRRDAATPTDATARANRPRVMRTSFSGTHDITSGAGSSIRSETSPRRLERAQRVRPASLRKSEERGLALGDPQTIQPRRQERGSFLRGRFRILRRDEAESHMIAGSKLRERIEVGSNDVRDLRIPADRLAVHAQNNGLPVVGHLDRSGSDGFGDKFARPPRQWFALQPDSHAITRDGHLVILREERAVGEPVSLRAVENAEPYAL